MQWLCLDKHVLGGLAILSVGVLVMAPQLLWTALPLLLLAACPLSMLLMGRFMMGRSHGPSIDQSVTTPLPQSGTPVEARYRIGRASKFDAQTASLRSQFQQLEDEMAALAQKIAWLEAYRAIPDRDIPTRSERAVTR